MRLQKKQEAKQRKQARMEKSKVDFQNPKLLLAKVVESKVWLVDWKLILEINSRK